MTPSIPANSMSPPDPHWYIQNPLADFAQQNKSPIAFQTACTKQTLRG